MDKKILVAFDDSDNAMRAVEYVAKNFATDNNNYIVKYSSGHCRPV